ncbi:MAG: hypothetical protein AB7O56_12025 [Bauldia sp.]
MRSASDGPGGPGVSLFVVGFRPSNDRRPTLARRDPVIDILEVELLLTVVGPTPIDEARIAADLHFAALEAATFTIADIADTRAVLRVLEMTAGTALLLRARIARQRAERPVPRVEEAVFNLTDRTRPIAAPPADSETAKPETRSARRHRE